MASLNDIETKIQRIIDKLSTKTITGTLPLTFTTRTAGAASDWSISGNDNVGKNLYDYENAELTDWYLDSNGEQRTGGGSYYRTQRVNVSPNAQYTISWQDAVQPGTTAPYVRICYYSGNTFISRSLYSGITTTGKTVTVTTPSNCDNILLQLDDKTSAQGQYFVDVMLNVGDTSADFEPYQVGVGQRTKNLFDKTATDINKGYAESYYITSNGSLIVSNNWNVSEYIDIEANTAYTLCRDTTSGKAVCYAEYDSSSQLVRAVAYSGVQNITFTTSSTTAKIRISIYKVSVSATMLVEGSTAPQTYIPYGYEIPITVNNTPQTFYIGGTPLTAGQSISKTSTGVDIAAIAGTNTITTELYNKPTMKINYKWR